MTYVLRNLNFSELHSALVLDKSITMCDQSIVCGPSLGHGMEGRMVNDGQVMRPMPRLSACQVALSPH